MRINVLFAAIAFFFPAAGSSQPAERYVVATAPIDLGFPSRGICLAIDPSDPHGVWWWDQGSTGCRSRSSGVFPAERAAVGRRNLTGPLEIRFTIQLHPAANSNTADYRNISLVLEGDALVASPSGARVRVERRRSLDIPERP